MLIRYVCLCVVCLCVAGVEDPRLSADEMDIQRQENIAYEYLCHLEEAKVYVDFSCSKKLHHSLQNKLSHFYHHLYLLATTFLCDALQLGNI